MHKLLFSFQPNYMILPSKSTCKKYRVQWLNRTWEHSLTTKSIINKILLEICENLDHPSSRQKGNHKWWWRQQGPLPSTRTKPPNPNLKQRKDLRNRYIIKNLLILFTLDKIVNFKGIKERDKTSIPFFWEERNINYYTSQILKQFLTECLFVP